MINNYFINKLIAIRYAEYQSTSGRFESIEEIFFRVANSIAKSEKDFLFWRNKYFDLFINLKFVPNSTTLMNAGKKKGSIKCLFCTSFF